MGEERDMPMELAWVRERNEHLETLREKQERIIWHLKDKIEELRKENQLLKKNLTVYEE